MIERDLRFLDTPGNMPFTEPREPGEVPGSCRILEPLSLDWFRWIAAMVFIAYPYLVVVVTPLRYAAVFAAVLAVGVAMSRSRLGGAGARGGGRLQHALLTALFGFLPAIFLPSLTQSVATFWWAFDLAKPSIEVSFIASVGPFAYGVINTGSLLLGLVVAMWAARRSLKPVTPPSKAWRRIRTSLVIASVLCFTWPITSAWINLMIPGPDGKYWLPF